MDKLKANERSRYDRTTLLKLTVLVARSIHMTMFIEEALIIYPSQKKTLLHRDKAQANNDKRRMVNFVYLNKFEFDKCKNLGRIYQIYLYLLYQEPLFQTKKTCLN